jgi:hypothetical protein
MSELKPQLVSGHAADESAEDHQREREVAAVSEGASGHQNGLTLQKGPDDYRQVPPANHERLEHVRPSYT